MNTSIGHCQAYAHPDGKVRRLYSVTATEVRSVPGRPFTVMVDVDLMACWPCRERILRRRSERANNV